MDFQLGGENHELTKEDVEERLKHVPPSDIRKHYVLISGRRYPVKQAVAVALNKPLAKFITTDALRILSNLGFEVGNTEVRAAKVKTASELFFEEYLRAHGLGYFQFEKELPGTLKRPDYSLNLNGQEILFEVKEFRSKESDFDEEGGAYDPYRPIREKIGAARKKFKDLENYPCCLVLYNDEKPLVHLQYKEFIFGAMLGDIAIEVPFRQVGGGIVAQESRTVFSLKRGKVIHREGRQVVVENTTISGILVLEHLNIGERRFNVSVARWEKNQGRSPTVTEYFQFIEAARGSREDISLRQLRVVVYENPCARIALIPELFRGPYDERYGITENRVERAFRGEEILKLENEEKDLDQRSPFERWAAGESET